MKIVFESKEEKEHFGKLLRLVKERLRCNPACKLESQSKCPIIKLGKECIPNEIEKILNNTKCTVRPANMQK